MTLQCRSQHAVAAKPDRHLRFERQTDSLGLVQPGTKISPHYADLVSAVIAPEFPVVAISQDRFIQAARECQSTS